MAPGGGADSAVAPTTTGNESNALAPPSYWIQVLLVDEWGDPVSGVRVFFDFDDGNQQAAVTAADGLASVMKQPNQGVMVRLEGNIFYTNESGEGLYEDPHESTRTLGAEELLADVAARHDLADSRLIYHYPRNAELRASRVALGLVTAGDTMIVPRDYAWYFHTKPATFPHALRLVVPALLEIVSLDPFFAPTHEKHHITYRIARLSKKEKLVVTITSPLYTDDILFTKELAGGALADGVHTLAWEGKTNCTSGDMVEDLLTRDAESAAHAHAPVDEALAARGGGVDPRRRVQGAPGAAHGVCSTERGADARLGRTAHRTARRALCAPPSRAPRHSPVRAAGSLARRGGGADLDQLSGSVTVRSRVPCGEAPRLDLVSIWGLRGAHSRVERGRR